MTLAKIRIHHRTTYRYTGCSASKPAEMKNPSMSASDPKLRYSPQKRGAFCTKSDSLGLHAAIIGAHFLQGLLDFVPAFGVGV